MYVNTITLDGNGFTDEEQLVLRTIWAFAKRGLGTPTFAKPAEADLCAAAGALVARGFLYRVAPSGPYTMVPALPGYALHGEMAEWIAELLFDMAGLAAREYR
jgi:hypothetical protein